MSGPYSGEKPIGIGANKEKRDRACRLALIVHTALQHNELFASLSAMPHAAALISAAKQAMGIYLSLALFLSLCMSVCQLHIRSMSDAISEILKKGKCVMTSLRIHP